jgi:hypothetical protein
MTVVERSKGYEFTCRESVPHSSPVCRNYESDDSDATVSQIHQMCYRKWCNSSRSNSRKNLKQGCSGRGEGKGYYWTSSVKSCNKYYKSRELEHMFPLSIMMRTVTSSHRTTGTLLIIVVRMHTFQTTALLRSALVKTFQLHRKVKVGPLEHSHLGLVGWITYWSLRNCVLPVKIIVGLIRKLNLTNRVRDTDTHNNEVALSLVMQAMTQVMRSSSIFHNGRDRIIGSHTSTKKTVHSWSRGGSTESSSVWTEDLTRACRDTKCLSANKHTDQSANYVPLVSGSRKFFLQHLRGNWMWCLTSARSADALVGLRSLEGMGPKSFVLSVDDDTEFRSRSEWMFLFYILKDIIFPINLLKKKNRGGCVSDNPIKNNNHGLWGWKLCLNHCLITMTVGLALILWYNWHLCFYV